MSIVPDSHKPILKEAYQKIYYDFGRRVTELRSEWDELEPILSELGIDYTPFTAPFNFYPIELEYTATAKQSQVIPNQSYNPNGSWLERAKFVMAKVGRPMTAAEIVNDISKFQPESDKKSIMNSVPATLSVAARENKIRREENKYKEFIYSLKQ